MRAIKKIQVRDWAKQHQAKQVRSTAKKQHETMLIKHHNELLARFFGIKTFSGQVAEKVNKQLDRQHLGIY